MNFLKPHAERLYALLRIMAGFMFMLHGMQKLFGLFGGVPPGAPAFIIYAAGGIEFVGGAYISAHGSGIWSVDAARRGAKSQAAV